MYFFVVIIPHTVALCSPILFARAIPAMKHLPKREIRDNNTRTVAIGIYVES